MGIRLVMRPVLDSPQDAVKACFGLGPLFRMKVSLAEPNVGQKKVRLDRGRMLIELARLRVDGFGI